MTPMAVVRFGGLTVLGSLLLAVSAHVAVPFWPVPMTMQTLVVLLLGALAGPALAAASVVAYVAEGVAGLPVFAHGSGLATLLGPTGGYIVGFLPAALIAARASGMARGPSGALTSGALLFAADAVLLGCGVAWLASLIGVEKAVAAGLLPFLAGEGLKVAIATVAVQLRAPARR